MVTEKVVVKRKHRNEFEIVENKEQKKSLIETLVFFFFFLNDTFGAECEPFFTFIFVIFYLVTEKVVEKIKHGNEFEFAEKGTEKT